ncbi:MAG: hypothetical protein KJ578_15795 [Bacteroidetes bacterium]|nr:hypothetical protein [Bacteroidota bacterium]
MLNLDISIAGLETFRQKFGDVPDSWVKTQVVKDAWQEIHTHFLQVERTLFSSQGGSGKHGKWPGYGRSERKYFGYKTAILGGEAQYILQWGKMGKRLGPSLFERSHADHVFEVSPDGRSASFGTRVPYAKSHQEGTNYNKWDDTTAPQRRVWDPSDQDRHRARQIMWQAIWASWDQARRDAFRAARAARARS